MTIVNRKLRQRQHREQLILDTANKILCQEGYSQLTMERIAKDIEYSKGTVYNHFSSKEDIISALGVRCLNQLLDFFRRAANYQASSRDRISAVVIAYNLYAQLNPLELQTMQLIKSQVIREKTCNDKQNEVLILEQQLTSIVIDIVRQAITANDVAGSFEFTIDSIVFGLWCMSYGANLLGTSGIPFSNQDLCNPLKVIWSNSQRLLDSYQWRPLSQASQLEKKYDEICNKLFADEINLINSAAKQ